MVETIDVDHKDKIQFKLWEKLTIEASSPQDNLSFVGALLSLEAQSSSPWWWHLEWLAKSFYPLWSSTAFHPSFLSGATKQICSHRRWTFFDSHNKRQSSEIWWLHLWNLRSTLFVYINNRMFQSAPKLNEVCGLP